MYLTEAVEKFVDMVEQLENETTEQKDKHIFAVQKYGTNLLKQFKGGRKILIEYVESKMVDIDEYVELRHKER